MRLLILRLIAHDTIEDVPDHDNLSPPLEANNENYTDTVKDEVLLGMSTFASHHSMLTSIAEYDEGDEINPGDVSRHSDDEDAEWDEYEDEDEQAALSRDVHDNDDALSKYSSETLSSTRSKRSRDEDENDDNATAYASPPETPGM